MSSGHSPPRSPKPTGFGVAAKGFNFNPPARVPPSPFDKYACYIIFMYEWYYEEPYDEREVEWALGELLDVAGVKHTFGPPKIELTHNQISNLEVQLGREFMQLAEVREIFTHTNPIASDQVEALFTVFDRHLESRAQEAISLLMQEMPPGQAPVMIYWT